MKLGEAIRKLREEREWTQDDLAFRAGSTAANISRIETGKHGVGGDLLNSLAYVFELKVYQLVALAEGVLLPDVPSRYSPEEEAIVMKFRTMGQEQKLLYAAVGEVFVKAKAH
ncbi:MAG: helix-turn-helix transcriptional regulator [Methylotenera sp.]|nr:helix-turn-helix transcriptional regulator [Methylotenera sp.]